MIRASARQTNQGGLKPTRYRNPCGPRHIVRGAVTLATTEPKGWLDPGQEGSVEEEQVSSPVGFAHHRHHRRIEGRLVPRTLVGLLAILLLLAAGIAGAACSAGADPGNGKTDKVSNRTTI